MKVIWTKRPEGEEVTEIRTVTQFKVNRRIDLDMYTFMPDIWHQLGGDFICSDPTPATLFAIFRDENVPLEGLVVEFK